MPALAQHVHPPVLVAAGHAQPEPSLAELVEQRHVLGRADRVPGGQHDAERREQDALGPGRQVGEEHQRVDRELEAFGVEVVLGHHQRVEADLVGVDRDLPDLVQQLLVRLDVPPDRPLGDLAFSSPAYPEPGICGFRKIENFTRQPP